MQEGRNPSTKKPADRTPTSSASPTSLSGPEATETRPLLWPDEYGRFTRWGEDPSSFIPTWARPRATDASHVYLLRHAVESRFKVGKADLVFTRAYRLGAAQFDLSRSIAFKVPSAAVAYKLEGAILHSFHRYRLELPEPVDGHTEWLSLECMERVVSLVRQNADLFDAVVSPPEDWHPCLRAPPAIVVRPTDREVHVELSERGWTLVPPGGDQR